MTSSSNSNNNSNSNNSNSDDKKVNPSKEPVETYNNTIDNNSENKPTGLIASILDRATKSGFGRKKLNPSKVEAAVAKKMDQIHKNPAKIRLTV